jgi:hypothetical protein
LLPWQFRALLTSFYFWDESPANLWYTTDLYYLPWATWLSSE